MAARRGKWWMLAALPVLAAAAGWLTVEREHDHAHEPLALLAQPIVLPPVQLVDHRGRQVTEAVFAGGWTFATLGFTFCPDVCPATLAQLAVVRQKVAEQHAGVALPRVVLISVDPERDTPARLASYVAAFDASFVGVTGAPAQVAALEESLTAFHRTGAHAHGEHYSVSHTGDIFLFDPAGRVVAKFEPATEPAQVAQQFAVIADSFARAVAAGDDAPLHDHSSHRASPPGPRT